MTNAIPSSGNTGKMPATPSRRWWANLDNGPRNYRWTELWLLLFPALFMLLGLLTLLVVTGQHINLSSKTLPPLDAFMPVIGLLLALLLAHFALIFVAPDCDQTLLPIAGMLSSIGVLMAIRLGPDLGQNSLGSKQLVFVIAGLGLCVVTVWATRDMRWLRDYPYTWAIIGALLVGITLAHAGGFNPNAPSRDVLSIGGGALSFQPSEVFKICLVVFFAGYLAENLKVLSDGGYRFGW
ncbi:MAG TPA: FtsW/RodA/SpoVE family cell cycle protein, partial [Ktedonobacterales bacterium]